jgi:hypothetical protein
MGAIVHIVLSCFYTITFTVGYRSLKAGEADVALKYGVATAVAVALDVGIYRLGVGLFS